MFLLSFVIGFMIYSFSYYQIGNTLYRIDSSGKKRWNFSQLLTTGFYEPIRFGKLCLENNNFTLYLKDFFFQPFNPWFIIPTSIALLHHPLQILLQSLHHHH